MIIKSRNYRREIKRVQNKQRSNVIKQLRENKTKNPSLYWKIIKGSTAKKDMPVTLENLYESYLADNVSCIK